MSQARNRVFSSGQSIGALHKGAAPWRASEIVYFTREDGETVIQDTSGNLSSDNAFFLTRTELKGGILTGSEKLQWRDEDEFVSNDFQAVPTNPHPYSSIAHLQFQDSPETAGLKARNLTNPGRPEILVPAFIAELKDIPKMVRQVGDIIRYVRNRAKQPAYTVASTLSDAKKAAASNLGYQFGWEQLLRELMTMTQFTDAVDRRRKELERLHSGKGLKRRIQLEKRSEVSPPTKADVFTSGFFWLIGEGGITTHEIRRWATVRWMPTINTPLPSMDADIRRIMTGLTVEALASNIWELIPWSWLVDYFSNLGDIVASTNNSMRVDCVSCCVMSHSKRTFTLPTQGWRTGHRGASVSMSGFTRLYEEKFRNVGIPPLPMPEVGLPILGSRQLSILASLAVMRIGK